MEDDTAGIGQLAREQQVLVVEPEGEGEQAHEGAELHAHGALPGERERGRVARRAEHQVAVRALAEVDRGVDQVDAGRRHRVLADRHVAQPEHRVADSGLLGHGDEHGADSAHLPGVEVEGLPGPGALGQPLGREFADGDRDLLFAAGRPVAVVVDAGKVIIGEAGLHLPEDGLELLGVPQRQSLDRRRELRSRR